MSAEEKPTVELAAVPPWAVELTTLVKRVSSNVDNVISAVDVLRDRVNAHDARFAEQDSRASTVSIRVKDASKVDLEHEAKLADEIVARTELAAKVDGITDELAKQSKAMGIGVAGLKWVASKEGRATMTQLAILVGVLYGILKSSGVVK